MATQTEYTFITLYCYKHELTANAAFFRNSPAMFSLFGGEKFTALSVSLLYLYFLLYNSKKVDICS